MKMITRHSFFVLSVSLLLCVSAEANGVRTALGPEVLQAGREAIESASDDESIGTVITLTTGTAMALATCVMMTQTETEY